MSKAGCCVDRDEGGGTPCTESTCVELPKGHTCADCAHIKRCLLFGFTEAESTSCDFFPRRFLPMAQPERTGA